MKPKSRSRSVLDQGPTFTKTKITVSAPGKLMLLGEHAVLYNHPCIVTAVDPRLHLTAEFIEEPFFILNAPDVKIKNYKKPISKLGFPRHPELVSGSIPQGATFVELATRSVLAVRKPAGRPAWPLQGPTFSGIKITTHSDFSPQYGFGSSSASTVCTIFALSKLFNLRLSQKQLFNLAYKVVLEIQGKGSGFDIAAAIYGGTIYFVTGGKTINNLSFSSLSRKQALLLRAKRSNLSNSLPLIVGYSGIKADTATLIQKVATLAQKHPQIVKKTFDSIKTVVENGKKAITNNDFSTLGELFNINQGYLESLGVSNAKLSAMIYAAREAGANGAKLSGAGGGDCIIALAPPNKKSAVEKAITRAGGKIIHVKTNTQGVKIES